MLINSKMVRSVLLMLISLVLIVGCSNKNKPDQAQIAACNGDPYLAKFGCSVDNVQQAAEKGDPDAQYALGYMYYYGIGTVQDSQTAKLWIARSAAQGQPLARKAISLMARSPRTQSNTKVSYASKNITMASQKPTVRKVSKEPKPIVHHMPNYHAGANREAVLKVLKHKHEVQQAAGQETTDHTVNTSNTTKQVTPEVRDSTEPTVLNHSSSETVATHPSIKHIREIGRQSIKVMEARLMHTPASYYTLQLMGNHKLATIKAYISKHHLESKAEFYYSTFHHSRWYMLTYGRYKSVKEAHAAIRNLPEAVRANNPWIKPIRDVQAEIKTREMVS